jgi:hypothetical protein
LALAGALLLPALAPALAHAQAGAAELEGAPLARVADRVALLGAPTEATGTIFGLHGLADSSSSGTSGAMGESTATSGETIGVYASCASADGIAGWFEHPAGGLLLSGDSGAGSFSVDDEGTLEAVSFVGDGSALVGGGGLSCAGCIDAGDLASQTITALELATGAVGTTRLAAGAVRSAKIAPGAVGASEIAAAAVGTAKIADGAVTTNQIAAGAVGSVELADGAVGTTAVASGAVTASKLMPWRFMHINHDDCLEPGEPGDLTVSGISECESRPCQIVPSVLFFDCFGNCSATVSQPCERPIVGRVLQEF